MAFQPMGGIDTRNRMVGTLSDEQAERLEGETAYLCSISPWSPYRRHDQGGNMEIPACPRRKDGTYEPFILVPIKGYNAFKDFGNGQAEPVIVSAKQRAMDLLSSMGQDRGVFYVGDDADEGPAAEDLAACRERFEEYGRTEILEADKRWARGKNPRDVGDHARWFADYFGITKEWAGVISTVKVCGACQAKNDPAAVRCAQCRYVLDWQKAYDMGALDDAEETRGLDRGFIQPLAQPGKAKG